MTPTDLYNQHIKTLCVKSVPSAYRYATKGRDETLISDELGMRTGSY